MLARETIDFQIKFISNYWNNPPWACVLVNDVIKFDGAITENTSLIKFSHTLEFDSTHCLTIKRSGKSNNEIRKNIDGTIEDQILIIDQIKIDGVDIRNILYTDSYNQPVYPVAWAKEQISAGLTLEKYVPGETHLGHNGTWRLNFTSPFYQFLINKMNG